MSWDRKRRGGSTGYYYRNVRRNGKPVKIYLGHGPAAKKAAAELAKTQQERQADRDARTNEMLGLSPANAAMNELHILAELLTRVTLVVAGFHEHRGQWRKRRIMSNQGHTNRRQPPEDRGAPLGSEPQQAAPTNESPESEPPRLRITEMKQEEFCELLRRAAKGCKDAMARLRQLLDDNPEIWERAGDLVALAEKEWIDLIGKGDWLASESMRRHIAKLKTELAGTQPTRLEQLLVDQVGVTYLAAYHGETLASTPLGNAALAMQRMKQAESGQKRLLKAVQTLTMLRSAAPRGLAPLDSLKIFGAEKKRA